MQRTESNIATNYNSPKSSITLSVSPVRHALFKIFRQAQYGQLLVNAPKDQLFLFGGQKSGPKACIDIHNYDALDALLTKGEVGFAEAYISGQWDTNNLPALLSWGLANIGILERYCYGQAIYALWLRFKSLCQANTLAGSKRNIIKHYDLGNDFYSLWLDESMTYSCAIFQNEKNRTLAEAQQAKYQRILDKLGAKKGDHILEIGCGWGGFAQAAAKKDIKVTGVTLSNEQKLYAEKRLGQLGLNGLATIELKDYRNVTGQFDHIVSIGMFEHVGERYWPEFFKVLCRCLKPNGKAMVQTITIDDDVFIQNHNKAGFIETYIFPGGMLPSKKCFTLNAEKSGLKCIDIFAFGRDYALTLRHWLTNFEAKKQCILDLGYDEAFIRMWRFYLAYCIAGFEFGRTDVMQVELVPATL